MTLPARARPAQVISSADPFGLWQAPAAVPSSAVSFGGLGEGAGAGDEPPALEEPPAAVWSLELTSDAGGQQALAVREQQVQAVQNGLELAAERLEALLAARAQPGAVSFAVRGAARLPEPERFLSEALDQLGPPGEAVSFGWREDLGRLVSTDWGELRDRLEALFDSVNRQLLHFVWVDTSLDGTLSARTVVAWSGDLSTCYRPDLAPSQIAAHQRSLQLALVSRSANLQAVITVAQLAAKITLAVTTPIGPVQALALAWEFVNSIVLPMVQKPSSH